MEKNWNDEELVGSMKVGELRGMMRDTMREEAELAAELAAERAADRVLGVYTEYIDGRFKAVDERFDHLEGRMDSVETTLAEHTEILKDLSVDMLAVKSDIKVINAKLDRKADVKDLAAVDRRVASLENGGER